MKVRYTVILILSLTLIAGMAIAQAQPTEKAMLCRSEVYQWICATMQIVGLRPQG